MPQLSIRSSFGKEAAPSQPQASEMSIPVPKVKAPKPSLFQKLAKMLVSEKMRSISKDDPLDKAHKAAQAGSRGITAAKPKTGAVASLKASLRGGKKPSVPQAQKSAPSALTPSPDTPPAAAPSTAQVSTPPPPSVTSPTATSSTTTPAIAPEPTEASLAATSPTGVTAVNPPSAAASSAPAPSVGASEEANVTTGHKHNLSEETIVAEAVNTISESATVNRLRADHAHNLEKVKTTYQKDIKRITAVIRRLRTSSNDNSESKEAHEAQMRDLLDKCDAEKAKVVEQLDAQLQKALSEIATLKKQHDELSEDLRKSENKRSSERDLVEVMVVDHQSALNKLAQRLIDEAGEGMEHAQTRRDKQKATIKALRATIAEKEGELQAVKAAHVKEEETSASALAASMETHDELQGEYDILADSNTCLRGKVASKTERATNAENKLTRLEQKIEEERGITRDLRVHLDQAKGTGATGTATPFVMKYIAKHEGHDFDVVFHITERPSTLQGPSVPKQITGSDSSDSQDAEKGEDVATEQPLLAEESAESQAGSEEDSDCDQSSILDEMSHAPILTSSKIGSTVPLHQVSPTNHPAATPTWIAARLPNPIQGSTVATSLTEVPQDETNVTQIAADCTRVVDKEYMSTSESGPAETDGTEHAVTSTEWAEFQQTQILEEAAAQILPNATPNEDRELQDSDTTISTSASPPQQIPIFDKRLTTALPDRPLSDSSCEDTTSPVSKGSSPAPPPMSFKFTGNGSLPASKPFKFASPPRDTPTPEARTLPTSSRVASFGQTRSAIDRFLEQVRSVPLVPNSFQPFKMANTPTAEKKEEEKSDALPADLRRDDHDTRERETEDILARPRRNRVHAMTPMAETAPADLTFDDFLRRRFPAEAPPADIPTSADATAAVPEKKDETSVKMDETSEKKKEVKEEKAATEEPETAPEQGIPRWQRRQALKEDAKKAKADNKKVRVGLRPLGPGLEA